MAACAHALAEDPKDDVVARFENNFGVELPAEQRISKVYRFHRRSPFREVCTGDRLLRFITPLVDGDIDVFLSQLVWKLPGALGQPWHQDASIFPFDPPTPIVGAWIALTPATVETSCLRVVPGSHRGVVLPHGFDRHSPTRGRYLALLDQTVSGFEAIEMAAGDLVVFDSRVLHSSADNVTDRARIALSFHFATAGTVDRSLEVFGQSPYNDWMPAHRRRAAD